MDKLRSTDQRSDPSGSDSLETDGGATRRRLLKQAATVAPMILTLRSGALMAATTCTGIVSNGGIPGENDYCASATPGAGGCPPSKVSSVNAVSESKLCLTPGAPGVDPNCQVANEYYCPTGSPVVLSSAAYQSLTGA